MARLRRAPGACGAADGVGSGPLQRCKSRWDSPSARSSTGEPAGPWRVCRQYRVSSACKPSVSSPTGRRMVPRSTASATGPSRPRCTAWCSSTPRPSSPTEAAAGASLPSFIEDEFDAFLECGILAHGFLRLRCGDCGHDKLVAFSCKRRGICPSCGGDCGAPGLTPACAGAPVGAVTADPAFARHSQSTGLTVSGLSYCWPRSPSG